LLALMSSWAPRWALGVRVRRPFERRWTKLTAPSDRSTGVMLGRPLAARRPRTSRERKGANDDSIGSDTPAAVGQRPEGQ
jgi:hypothetical protein